jgi:hypothetical protein
MKSEASAWLPIHIPEATHAAALPAAPFDGVMTPPATGVGVQVWPAHLPAGARWLPYSAQPTQAAPALIPPIAVQPPAPRHSAPRQPMPLHFWRRLLVAATGSLFIGVGIGVVGGLLTR